MYATEMIYIMSAAVVLTAVGAATWRIHMLNRMLDAARDKNYADAEQNRRLREGDADRVERNMERRLEQARSAWEQERKQLTEQIVQLASRPPVMLKDTSPDIIAAVTKAITEIMGGGQPITPVEEPRTPGQMNNVEPGEWYPDVEFDNWLNTRGDWPKTAGWLPPPRVEYTDEPDLSADNLGLEQQPRPDGDNRMFRSGEGGVLPEGGTE